MSRIEDSKANFMPHFVDLEDNTWVLMSLDFCIDFGGRQIQFNVCKDAKGQEKTFVYYYLDDDFLQWSEDEVENVDASALINSSLHKALKPMFDIFAKETDE
jgi:hypothetical protein